MTDNKASLQFAIEDGNISEVQRLIPLLDTKEDQSGLLGWAVRSGQVECLKLLIPVCDPAARNSHALWWATEYGHYDMVDLLLPLAQNQDIVHGIVPIAARNGFTDIVELLLPYCDSAVRHTDALRQAALFGRWDCVDVLWDTSDVDAVLAQLKQQYPNKTKCWQVLENRSNLPNSFDCSLYTEDDYIKVHEELCRAAHSNRDDVEELARLCVQLGQRYTTALKSMYSAFNDLCQHSISQQNLMCLKIAVEYAPQRHLLSGLLRDAVVEEWSEAVTLLLPRMDPLDDKYWFLGRAGRSLNAEIFDLLLPHSNFEKALQSDTKFANGANHNWMIARKERWMLNNCGLQDGTATTKRKI